MPNWMYWVIAVAGLGVDAVATVVYYRTKEFAFLVIGAPFAAIGLFALWFAAMGAIR